MIISCCVGPPPSIVVERNFFSVFSPPNSTYIVVHFVEPKCSDVEVCQFLFFRDADIDLVLGRIAIALVFIFRGGPVLHAHHLRKVERLREHHDTADVLLPHHPPKVEDRILCWSLGYDVSVWL